MLKAVQKTSASALQKVIDGMADLMKVYGTNEKEIDVFVANVKSKIFRVDGGGASSATPTTTGAVAPVASTDAAAKPIAPPAGKANKTPAPTTTDAAAAKSIAPPTGKTGKPSNNGAAPKPARHLTIVDDSATSSRIATLRTSTPAVVRSSHLNVSDGAEMM